MRIILRVVHSAFANPRFGSLTCNYAHRMQTADGHAPIVDVLVAADVDMPSLEETKPAVPVEKKVLKRKKSG